MKHLPPTKESREYAFLRLFQEVTRLITSTLDPDQVLDRIVRKIPTVLGVDAATIRLLDATGARLILLAASGLSERYLNRGPVDTERSVIEALEGTPVAVFDATSDPRISYSDAARAEGVKSILVAPIPIRGKMRGVLRLLTRHHREFKSDELEFAAALADQCGIAIQNAISYQRIAKLVIELEHQEDFLQSVMDSLDEDLFVLDARYRITMVNRTFVKNHRMAESDIIGKPCHQVIRACARENCPFEHREKLPAPSGAAHRTQVADGDTYLEIITSPVSIFDPGGKTDFIIGAIRDVTDHVRLQQEQLARERLQGVLEMAGAAAHELNSPLFAALGTAQMALAESGASDPRYRDIETVISNLKVVTELTQKMGRITRYESKDYAGDVKIVDIRKASRPLGDTGD